MESILTSHKKFSHSPVRHIYLGDGVALCGARNQVTTPYPLGEIWSEVHDSWKCKKCSARLGEAMADESAAQDENFG